LEKRIEAFQSLSTFSRVPTALNVSVSSGGTILTRSY
jgi:hypothetical protein